MELLEDRVLITILDKNEEVKTAGGILLAKDEKEPDTRSFYKARVELVGEGSITENGIFVPTKIRKGDTVLVPKSISGKWIYEGNEFYITSERNIVAILTREG